MSESQFKFDRDTVAPNIKTPIVFNEERMTIGDILDKLNELNKENKLYYQQGIELQSKNKALKKECKEFKEGYDDLNRKVNKLIRLCEEFNIDWKRVMENDK